MILSIALAFWSLVLGRDIIGLIFPQAEFWTQIAATIPLGVGINILMHLIMRKCLARPETPE